MSEPTAARVEITTDATGAATAYSDNFNGRIICVSYVKGDFADGVDFVISLDSLGSGVWTQSNVNASAYVYPTHLVQDQTGSDTDQRDYIYSFNDRVKVVIGQGGNAKTGTFMVYYD